MPYTIEIDSSSEEQILEDLKQLVTVNTGGAVTSFEPESFHTALLETQAYSYRQIVRYLQYAPFFLATAYLVNVLGVPKREGGRSITALVNFVSPLNQSLRLFEGTELSSLIGGTVYLGEDFVIPSGTSEIQLQLIAGNGVIKAGDFLYSPGLLPPSQITVTSADPNLSTEATFIEEGWEPYLDRVAGFIAATPQYTLESIVKLLKVSGVTATGYELVRGGGYDVCVLPGDLSAANSALSGYSQRFNQVRAVVSKKIEIFASSTGEAFTLEQIRKFNQDGFAARCDVLPKSIFTLKEDCRKKVNRSLKYLSGDLVKTGSSYKRVNSDSNHIVTIFGAAANGLGTLVRFDPHTPSKYSLNAGYTSNGNYYVNSNPNYIASPIPTDIKASVQFSNNVIYSVGQLVLQGTSWGLVVTTNVQFPESQVTLTNADEPYIPNSDQSISTGDYLILFGNCYLSTAEYTFDWETPLINLVEVFFHGLGITEEPIYSKYPLGTVYGGTYWNGQVLIKQPVPVTSLVLPEDYAVVTSGNNYLTSVSQNYQEISCDVPLKLNPCEYFG